MKIRLEITDPSEEDSIVEYRRHISVQGRILYETGSSAGTGEGGLGEGTGEGGPGEGTVESGPGEGTGEGRPEKEPEKVDREKMAAGRPRAGSRSGSALHFS